MRGPLGVSSIPISSGEAKKSSESQKSFGPDGWPWGEVRVWREFKKKVAQSKAEGGDRTARRNAGPGKGAGGGLEKNGGEGRLEEKHSGVALDKIIEEGKQGKPNTWRVLNKGEREGKKVEWGGS